jgi:hypothetical protein
MNHEDQKKQLYEMAETMFKAYDDKIKELQGVDGLSIPRIKEALFAISTKITQFQLTIKAMGSSPINKRGFQLAYDEILRELKEIR